MIHVYTGKGKGKTTAALGLALRAAGAGKEVAVIRFLKGGRPGGELESLRRIAGIRIYSFGTGERVSKESVSRPDRRGAKQGWEKAREIMNGSLGGVLVLDEINCVLAAGLLSPAAVAAGIKRAGGNLEIVLTGRDAPPEVLKAADYVTEMREIKHPYRRGVSARPGIEY